MEKLTTDLLAARGFWFLGHNLMTDGVIIVNVYGKVFTSGPRELHTVADLEAELALVSEPTKKKAAKA